MKIIVTQRHLVNDKKSFEELKSMAERTISALDWTRHELHVSVVYKPCEVSFNSLLPYEKGLSNSGATTKFQVADTNDGPGTMVSDSLFNVRKKTMVVMDADIYQINNPVIAGAIDIASNYLSKNKKTLAIGFRTNIRLASPKSMNDLRNAYEVFLSSFANSTIENPLRLDLKMLNPAYKKFGDLFSGFYIFNHDSDNAKKFLSSFDKLRNKVDFRGFGMDYYLSLKTYILDKSLFGIFVPSSKNISSKKRRPIEVKQMLKKDSIELLKTDLGNQLRNHITKNETHNNLLRYFKPNVIQEAKDLLLA